MIGVNEQNNDYRNILIIIGRRDCQTKIAPCDWFKQEKRFPGYRFVANSSTSSQNVASS